MTDHSLARLWRAARKGGPAALDAPSLELEERALASWQAVIRAEIEAVGFFALTRRALVAAWLVAFAAITFSQSGAPRLALTEFTAVHAAIQSYLLP